MKNKISALFGVFFIASLFAATAKMEKPATRSTTTIKPATTVTSKPAVTVTNKPAAAVTNKPVATVATQPPAANTNKPVVAETARPLAVTNPPAVKAAPTTAPAADTNKPAGEGALFADPVVARGRDFEIRRGQLDEAFISAKGAAAANGVTFTEGERSLLEVRLLNELMVGKILTAKATEADKAKAAEAADKFIADARRQFISEDAFRARLKAGKMTLEGLRQKLVGDAIPSVVLERELKEQINVTDSQIKKFYMDSPSKFEQPEMVHAAHILIGTRDTAGLDLSGDQKKAKRKQIEDLLKRAKDGEDFGKLATQYSEDPGSKANSGEYTFPRGQMVPEFESVAFALKKNEISGVVTTTYGFHIIKQLEKMPARVVPLAEAMPRIKEFLTSQEAAKLAPGYFEKLKKGAGAEILDEALKAADKKAREQVSPDKPAAK
jgi:parvulin-like peptidyl-prolyl isomerase